MKTTQALKYRDRAYLRVKQLFSLAKKSHIDAGNLYSRFQSIKDDMGKCPGWAYAYLDGAFKVLMDDLYHNHLEFCSQLHDGTVLSHHSNSERYYQKAGYEPKEITIGNIVKHTGHYYRDSKDAFSISEKEIRKGTVTQ